MLGKREMHFLATVGTDGTSVSAVPTRLTLPTRLGDRPRFWLSPTAAQFRALKHGWKVGLSATILDPKGEVRESIEAPLVYIEKASGSHHSNDYAVYSMEAEPSGLQVCRLSRSAAESLGESRIRFWISNNPRLSPAMSGMVSYDGSARFRRHKRLHITAGGYKFVFDKEFHYEPRDEGQFRSSRLVAECKANLSARDTEAIKNGPLAVLEDALLAASLGSGVRTICAGWTASDGASIVSYYRGALVYPSEKPRAIWDDDGPVDRRQFAQFFRKATRQILREPRPDVIRKAIWVLVPGNRSTIEDSYRSLFGAVEELLQAWSKQKKIGRILVPSRWAALRKSLKLTIKQQVESKSTRSLLYSKLTGLNYVPLQHIFDRYRRSLKVESADLWPLFSADGSGLSDIRNRLVHGDFPTGPFNELMIAKHNLLYLLTRMILATFNWPLNRSTVHPAMLSKHITAILHREQAQSAMRDALRGRGR